MVILQEGNIYFSLLVSFEIDLEQAINVLGMVPSLGKPWFAMGL